MDIGSKLKKLRENHCLSQEELALKLFVSRQTISNWETNKTLPDIKSLINISYIFNVSLDNFLKEDLKEMKKMVDNESIKRFNWMSVVFLGELILLAVTAYPLFMEGLLGAFIWLILFLVTLHTSSTVEKFKKENDLQTYKEIIAYVEGKTLSHDELEQEKGKKPYQTLVFAVMAGVIVGIIAFITILIYHQIM